MVCHDFRDELRKKLANKMKNEQLAVKAPVRAFKPIFSTNSEKVHKDTALKPRLQAMRPRCFEGILYPPQNPATTQQSVGCDLLELWYEIDDKQETAKVTEKDQVQTNLDAEDTLSDISNFDLDLPDLDLDEFVKSVEDESKSKLPSILLEAPDWETFTKNLV